MLIRFEAFRGRLKSKEIEWSEMRNTIQLRIATKSTVLMLSELPRINAITMQTGVFQFADKIYHNEKGQPVYIYELVRL